MYHELYCRVQPRLALVSRWCRLEEECRRGPGRPVLHFTACNSDTNFISTQNIVIQHHWPLLAKLWTSRSWSEVIRSLAWYFLHTNWPNWAGCCWKRHSSTQEIWAGVWSWSRHWASSCSVCCVPHANKIYNFCFLTKNISDIWATLNTWLILLLHTIVPKLTIWPPFDQSGAAVCWVLRGGGWRWNTYSPHLANYWD